MERFLNDNEGLRSRFAAVIDFPDLPDDDLAAITSGFLEEAGLNCGSDATTAIRRAFHRMPRDRGFGNGRTARQLAEDIRARQATRLIANHDGDLQVVLPEDVPLVAPPPTLCQRSTGTGSTTHSRG